MTDAVLGMLEQTWGEYWRQAADLRTALDHKHRALNIFERVGDQRSVMVTHLNLGILSMARPRISIGPSRTPVLCVQAAEKRPIGTRLLS